MTTPAPSVGRGIIAWFAANSVAANLLMLFIIVAGLFSLSTIRKQTTPDFETSNIVVQVPYLGAAPQEVEQGVVIKIEEAIQDVKGIDKLTGQAVEGMGTVTAEVAIDADINEVLNEIKTNVDSISTFPALTEKPTIFKQEFPIHVVFVALYGDLDEFARKSLAQDIRDGLMRIPEVNQVQFLGDRDYEISIEVSEQTLRQYDLTMIEVSDAVRAASIDLPGGEINSDGGDIRLRTIGQVYTGNEFADLVLRTYANGTRLTLGDVATIRDGFVETEEFGRLNGTPTAMLRVLASGQQNELKTAAVVRDYVDQRRETLPDGINLDIWVDRSHYLNDRLLMMLKNMGQGALLVFLMLSLFLRAKVAFWVIVGIPVTFLGALWLMPINPWPVSINVISLFGFIMVLGIVVDDAIIIGESIYTEIRRDGHSLESVVRGARKVAVPATFGVLTTIAAFAPLLFVDLFIAPFFQAIAVVVSLCLLFSLVESKLILPAHLAHAKIAEVDEQELFDGRKRASGIDEVRNIFLRINRRTQHGLHYVIDNWYRPWLGRAIDNAGITVSLFFAGLIVTIGLLLGGAVRIVIFPDVPGDFVLVNLQMQDGTSPRARNEAIAHIEQVAFDMGAEYADEHPDSEPLINYLGVFSNGDTGGQLFAELPLNAVRDVTAFDIIRDWRTRVGDIPGAKELTFSGGNNIGGGAPLNFVFRGDNPDVLRAAANELQEYLATFDAVFDIRNSSASGGQEIKLTIKPEAEALGLSQAALGRQVRQAFFGEEAQRIQRGKDEVKVMIRYPRAERRSVADLENMYIRTPAGDEVPFNSVADVSFGASYSAINRLDRTRTVSVLADINPQVQEPGELIEKVSSQYIPGLLARYPGVTYGLDGSSQNQAELLVKMGSAFLVSLFMIYTLIAIPLRSYVKPLIIMSVIPFGLIGAVIGHILLGKALSMFSLFGLVALAGVVVNDSLIMMDFINRARADGIDPRTAVIESGAQRFRAIILTSVTTAAGLMPIIFETSIQAQWVMPMAISVSFGIIFATLITLFLVPSLYMLARNFRDWILDREPEGVGHTVTG